LVVAVLSTGAASLELALCFQRVLAGAHKDARYLRV
jgi:hypothetical protein